MRRLAIFDPANGHQPMVSADGRRTLIFNGAIYNHAELRRELEGRGHVFQTQCDTEVLLHAWCEWGVDGLARLRGMWAFAVWDRAEKALTLVRDPLGIKPLYLVPQSDGLLFASELNALRASGRLSGELSPAAIDSYLQRLAVPAPFTIYRDASSLLPGEWLMWRNGQITRQTYWNLPPASETRQTVASTKSDAEFDAALREQLEDTIRAHRLADVPVGCFLSGGLDSAIVAGLMTRLGSERLKTFSIGFEETAYSETGPAAETARHFGTDHREIVVTGRDALTAVPEFVAALDQPTGDGFNTFLVSRAARAGGVTAALSGLGGDELFGGYPSFRDSPRVARLLPAWSAVPGSLRRPVVRWLDRGDGGRRKLAGMLRRARDIHEVADRQREVLSADTRRALLPRWPAAGESAPHPAGQRLRHSCAGAPPLAIVSAWELGTYMTDVLLRDSDVFSMRASLELRVPFVDRPFIEWLWRSPVRQRIRNPMTKAALVRAVGDLLPPGLLSRPKRGFTLPFPVWMRGVLRPWLDDLFAPPTLDALGWLDRDVTGALWLRFRDGNDDKEWSRVWSIAMLVAFATREARR